MYTTITPTTETYTIFTIIPIPNQYNKSFVLDLEIYVVLLKEYLHAANKIKSAGEIVGAGSRGIFSVALPHDE